MSDSLASKWISCLLILVTASVISALPTSVRVTIGGQPSGANKTVYAFTTEGAYTGFSSKTNSDSVAWFDLSHGYFKFRYTEDSQQWFSESVASGTEGAVISVPDYSEAVLMTDGEPAGLGIQTHYFLESGSYTGLAALSDASSIVKRRLKPDNYRLRITWHGKHFYSEVFTAPLSSTLTVPIPKPTTVSIQLYDRPLSESSLVYAFTESGAYTGVSALANSSGTAHFALTDGNYKFRFSAPDGQNRFTDVFTTSSLQRDFSWTGLFPYVIRIRFSEQGESGPIDLPVYAFGSNQGTNTYLGYFRPTDFNGDATFWLPEGDYIFRYPWHGLNFFSSVFSEGGIHLVTIPPVTLVSITDGSGVPSIEGPVYMYAEDGRYLNVQKQADRLGNTLFYSPHHEPRLKFATDSDGVRWYSEAVDAGSTAVIAIPSLVQFRITQNDNPVQYGKKLYLFRSDGSYANRQLEILLDGRAELRIPGGNWKLRFDNEGVSVFSQDFFVPATSRIDWDISPLSSVMVKRNNKGYGGGKQVHAFLASGAYLGQAKTLGANGIAEFLLPTAESVKFRFTEDGRHFYSNPILPGDSAELIVPVATTVCFSVNGTIPEGSLVHVFDSNATYTGVFKALLPSGCQDFSLGAGSYRFRLSHAGIQHYSDFLSSESSHTVYFGQGSPAMQFLDFNLSNEDISYSNNPYLQGKLRWGHGALVSFCGMSQQLPETGPVEIEFQFHMELPSGTSLECLLTTTNSTQILTQEFRLVHSSAVPQITGLNPSPGTTVNNPLSMISGSFDGFVGEILCGQLSDVWLPMTHNGKSFACKDPVVMGDELVVSLQIFEPEPRSYEFQYPALQPSVPKISRIQWEETSFNPAPNPYHESQSLSIQFDADGPGVLGFLVRAVNGDIVYSPSPYIQIPSSGRHGFQLWNGYFDSVPALEGKWVVEVFLVNPVGTKSYLAQQTVRIWY